MDLGFVSMNLLIGGVVPGGVYVLPHSVLTANLVIGMGVTCGHSPKKVL